jgi:hypothetical protein
MPARASSTTIAAAIILSALVAPLWVLSLATLGSLGNSDAAGNAIG